MKMVARRVVSALILAPIKMNRLNTAYVAVLWMARHVLLLVNVRLQMMESLCPMQMQLLGAAILVKGFVHKMN